MGVRFLAADCSLVPREPVDKKSWEADLYPNVPVIALRLDVERGRLFDESLTNATRGRHLPNYIGWRATISSDLDRGCKTAPAGDIHPRKEQN